MKITLGYRLASVNKDFSNGITEFIMLSSKDIQFYYINTSEMPDELSRVNIISSHVKITRYFTREDDMLFSHQVFSHQVFLTLVHCSCLDSPEKSTCVQSAFRMVTSSDVK